MKESVNEAYPEILTSFKEDFHWLVDRGFIPVDPDMSKWRNVQVLAAAPDENASMATTVKMVSTENPDWESLPKDKERYEHCMLFDKHVLFIDGRFNRESLPKGLYAYDLRGSDDDPGEPARVKEGRYPLRQSAYRVNCDTKRTAPPTSPSERLVLPFSSSNIRSFTSFASILSATDSVSVLQTPRKTRYPLPMDPISRPSTDTEALFTRCTSSFMISPPYVNSVYHNTRPGRESQVKLG